MWTISDASGANYIRHENVTFAAMKSTWKAAAGIFITGLLTLLPALLTLYLVAWLVGVIERIFSKPLKWIVPEGYPGMGLLIAVAVIFGVGLLMRGYLFRQVFRQVERVLLEIPVVRSIYGALRDLLGLFGKHKDPALQVVAVTLPGTQWRLLGFVTRKEFSDLPGALAKEGDVAVYLPMSYQVGGYTVFVPSEQVIVLDMSREDAMKFILTAGLKAQPAPGMPGTPPVQPAGRAPL